MQGRLVSKTNTTTWLLSFCILCYLFIFFYLFFFFPLFFVASNIFTEMANLHFEVVAHRKGEPNKSVLKSPVVIVYL